MGSFPLSLVSIQSLGTRAECAWSPEPVFPLDEAARILGIRKQTLIQTVRRRFSEVKLPRKDMVKLTTTFGPALTEYGEVKIKLRTPGGPQEHVCLTHYGLFRHAIYIRTPEAKEFALRYPAFLLALASGEVKGPQQIAARYQYILDAPRGQKAMRIKEVACELGKSARTVRRNTCKIIHGHVTPEGMPIMRRPGPPKGFRAGLPRRAVRYLLASNF